MCDTCQGGVEELARLGRPTALRQEPRLVVACHRVSSSAHYESSRGHQVVIGRESQETFVITTARLAWLASIEAMAPSSGLVEASSDS